MHNVSFDSEHGMDEDYSLLYANLDDTYLLQFIRKKGNIDVNEVNTNMNYCGNKEKDILPYINSLKKHRYIKLVNETSFGITFNGRLKLIYNSKAWTFWLLVTGVLLTLLSTLLSLVLQK